MRAVARLIQQLMFETILLALGGGLAGLLVAKFGVDLIVHFLAQQLPRATEISLDASVLGFTLAISRYHRNCGGNCTGMEAEQSERE